MVEADWVVVGADRQEHDAGNRRDVDDGATPLLFHMWQDRFAGEEHTLEIDVADPVPAFLAGLHGPTQLQDADVVVEDVDVPIGAEAVLDHSFDLVSARHICLVYGTVTAFFVDDGLGLLGCGRLMSTVNTCAPSRAKSTAVALPLPHPGPEEPAPVTMATLSFKRSPIFRVL